MGQTPSATAATVPALRIGVLPRCWKATVRRISWVSLPVAVLFAFLAFARASSASVATPQCGDVLTASVVLKQDLVCPGDGLTIPGFVNVTLDLNGYSIVGSGGGAGIAILPWLQVGSGTDPGSVRVENGSVRGFDIGVRVDTNIPHPTPTVGLERLFIRDNRVGVIGGIDGGGPDTTLADSIIAHNMSDGVFVAFIRPFRMINDQVRDNGGGGITAFEDSLSLLQDSFVAHNAGDGARLSSSIAAITGNTFLGNGGTGLSVEEKNCSFLPFYLVSNNIATGNGGGGMSMAVVRDICDPPPAPPPGSGNSAWHNDVFQCVLIVCAPNPGHAKQEDGS